MDATHRGTVGSYLDCKWLAIQLPSQQFGYGNRASEPPGANFHLTENLGFAGNNGSE